MKTNLKQSLFIAIGVAAILLSACSKKTPITPEEPIIPVKGVYILNEGSFTADNSSLSYLDFATNKVTVDIFKQNNPSHSLGSGVADMDVYGNLLFITATESNKVEILDASTAKVLKTVAVEKPRYIAFYSGKAFITTYQNKVVVIDTLSKGLIGNGIPVGRTPEYIVTLGDKLYVANSGSGDAITGGNYDNTISVINPNSLTEEAKIVVADNVYHLFTDGKELFANTMDVYEGVWPNSVLAYPSKLYKINTSAKEVEKTFEFGVSLMDFYQNGVIFISNNYEEGSTNLYAMSLSSLEPTKKTDIIKATDLNYPNFPYALSINPENGDLWYAKTDYEFDGTVYHYKNGSNEAKEYTVGLNPSVFVFK